MRFGKPGTKSNFQVQKSHADLSPARPAILKVQSLKHELGMETLLAETQELVRNWRAK